MISDQSKQTAPLMPDLLPTWHEIAFNGSLFKESVYRYPAGPEVDAAWEGLGVNCMFMQLVHRTLPDPKLIL